MINKKNIWFLTLFSLVLVLSVYYITMPSDVLVTSKTFDNVVSNISEESEDSSLVAARVEKEEKVLKDLEDLNNILIDVSKKTDEKNEAYEKMKSLNEIKGEESKLEKKIKDTFNISSVVTIDGDNIKVVASSKEHNSELANNIMRTIQENYENKMYITVKFE